MRTGASDEGEAERRRQLGLRLDAREGRDRRPSTRDRGDERQLTVVRDRSLMTESEIRRLRPFCRLGVALAADCRRRARGSRRRQSRSAGSRKETQSVRSLAIHNHAFGLQNGCVPRV